MVDNKSYLKVSVYLALGTNLGEREDNINHAIQLLISSGVLSDINISSIYETEPFGISNQPWFLNIAIKANTLLNLFELVYFCKSIEYIVGRKARKKWHEREIDIDILFYGDINYESLKLTVPHKGIQERKFVLMPLNEIDASFNHPVLNSTITELLDSSKDELKIRRLKHIEPFRSVYDSK